MFTEDFIMRMIRLATAALAQILRLKSAGQYQDAQEAVDQALEQVLGLKPNLVKSLGEASFLELFHTQDGLDHNRLAVVADLLKEDGDLKTLQGNPEEAQLVYQRALAAYLEVYFRLGGGAAPFEKIEALMTALEPGQLSFDTQFGLFNYYEQTGRLARASTILRPLAQHPDAPGEIESEVEAFYQRLLEKTDTALIDGGLSRAEVLNRNP